MKTKSTLSLVQLSFFMAIIVLLAVTPFLGYIPLGFTRATIIHVPVIIGSVILGPKKGALLGFVFGVTSLLSNTFNPTLTSFVFTPFYSLGSTVGNPWSLVICFIPRILVGVVPYYVYSWIKKTSNNEILGLGFAGLLGSLTNTLLVMNAIYIFFGEQYAVAKEVDLSELYGIIMGIIGINGIPEAVVASILTMGIAKFLLKYQKK